MELKWYKYDQNNSGGSFVVNEDVAHNVYIQAPNASIADAMAEHVGIYFDGVSKGWDCSCCGDRWYEGSELEDFDTYGFVSGLGFSKFSFDNIEDMAQFQANDEMFGREGQPAAILYYADGTKKIFRKEKAND